MDFFEENYGYDTTDDMELDAKYRSTYAFESCEAANYGIYKLGSNLLSTQLQVLAEVGFTPRQIRHHCMSGEIVHSLNSHISLAKIIFTNPNGSIYYLDVWGSGCNQIKIINQSNLLLKDFFGTYQIQKRGFGGGSPIAVIKFSEEEIEFKL